MTLFFSGMIFGSNRRTTKWTSYIDTTDGRMKIGARVEEESERTSEGVTESILARVEIRDAHLHCEFGSQDVE